MYFAIPSIPSRGLIRIWVHFSEWHFLHHDQAWPQAGPGGGHGAHVQVHRPDQTEPRVQDSLEQAGRRTAVMREISTHLYFWIWIEIKISITVCSWSWVSVTIFTLNGPNWAEMRAKHRECTVQSDSQWEPREWWDDQWEAWSMEACKARTCDGDFR